MPAEIARSRIAPGRPRARGKLDAQSGEQLAGLDPKVQLRAKATGMGELGRRKVLRAQGGARTVAG